MNDNKNIRRDAPWREELRRAISAKERTSIPRVKMPQLDPAYRIACNEEVNCGLDDSQAAVEASRCLDCPAPTCTEGCPVGINIPDFIKNLQHGDIAAAIGILKQDSALPAVCGRVCPQERQCESRCIYHKMKKEPVAIGSLERYVADKARAEGIEANTEAKKNGIKVAVAGSGPAALSFAGEMSRRGFDVEVFEALHEIGGVLKYGIPEFRLPNSIVDYELDNLSKSGVKFHTNTIVGKTLTFANLVERGFKGLFVASGAGLPRFMGIPGENLCGILSSNEYLTRINLMGAGRGTNDTPAPEGHSVAVIGGGNTAMDSARTARRMGAEKVMIFYRRSEAEMPARKEEIEHAKEEGIEFITLSNPVEYIGDEHGHVRSVRVQRMKLGEPDESGRRSPVPVEGAIDTFDIDLAIVSVGVSPNPLIPNSIEGLELGRRGTLVVDDNLKTSIDTIYAGGDIVRGGATVILAMGDGRHAACAMAKKLLS